MPLLITPAQPFKTPAGLPVSQVYAIICKQGYDLFSGCLTFSLAYFISEQAYTDRLATLQINTLPQDFAFSLAPAQTAVLQDPFSIMESYARTTLLTRLGESTSVENVA